MGDMKSHLYLSRKKTARLSCFCDKTGAPGGTRTHTVAHTRLKRTRLPIPPLVQFLESFYIICKCGLKSNKNFNPAN